MSITSESLRAFIKENFLFGREPDFADDDSFLELGIIDSTGVLELVAFLEEQNGFTIADNELVPENLDSVSNILAFVQRKTEHVDVSA
ncbi:MAG: acyl carrier protein [Pirellulales bacterium]|nr:acyl carrier protein [Pirellulales bacterium]